MTLVWSKKTPYIIDLDTVQYGMRNGEAHPIFPVKHWLALRIHASCWVGRIDDHSNMSRQEAILGYFD